MNFSPISYFDHAYNYMLMMNLNLQHQQLNFFEASHQPYFIQQYSNFINIQTQKVPLENYQEEINRSLIVQNYQKSKHTVDSFENQKQQKNLRKINILSFAQNYAKQSKKRNKNMNSNILTYFTVYIKDVKRMKVKFSKLISNLKLEMDLQRLSLLIEKYIKPKKHYCNPSYYYGMFQGITCPQQLAKFLRIALIMFIKHDLPLFIRKTPKMKASSKIVYLKCSRILLEKLLKPNNEKLIKKII